MREYLKPLDGLRALAVALVFVFHAAPDVLHGGYVGVDVFFVLSGYLITTLLMSEWGITGRLDLPRFYARRAIRLYPALLLLLVLAIPTALWLGQRGVGGDVAAGITYTSDFWSLRNTDHVHGLGQLWSLAVEEQFYLIWPLALLLLLRLAPPRRMHVIAAAVAVCVVLKAVAFDLGGWQAAYFTPWGSADELLVGAALALGYPQSSPSLRRRLGSPGIGALGIAVVLTSAGVLREVQDPRAYRGGLLVVALASACVIAHVVASDQSGPLSMLLSIRVMRWGGQRSYGIYLFHLLALDVAAQAPGPRSLRIGSGLLLAFVLAEISYRAVEMPTRKSLRPRLQPQRGRRS